MMQIDPALIQMLIQYGLLKPPQPQQPGLLGGVSGKPVSNPQLQPIKTPIQSIGVRG